MGTSLDEANSAWLTPISGLLLIPLKIIPAKGGPVLKMASAEWPLIDNDPLKFGEIYFSEVEPGCVKAWKRHFRQTQRFAVPAGKIRIALYDDRPDSPSCGGIYDIILGRPDNYNMLIIPPLLWYGFKCEGDENALVCNLVDIPHHPEEGEKIPANCDKIPWYWSI